MEIVFFHKCKTGTPSIEESFHPIIDYLSQSNEVKEFNVPFAGGSPIALLKNILFIRKHSTKNGINHISGVIHYGILGLIGRKSVLTIHDDYAIRQVRHGFFEKIYKWIFWIYLPIRTSTATICITPSTLKKIKDLYPSSKLQMFTHHVIPSVFSDKKKKFDKETPRFLQIGTDNNKNLETTLYALAGLKCRLTVLKPMNDLQKKMAKELKISYVNKFNLPFKEVVEEYDNCDVVLFPSLFEGFGMPIMEAQASGKPVITTDAEPMNWVAGDGAALLSNPKDVKEYRSLIEKILYDDEYREGVVAKGFENSKRFSLENSVDGYLKIYKKVLGK